jgi:hypothetical protein
MKDTLREKNVTIKDLNKSLDIEKKKVADLLAKLNTGSGGRQIGLREESKP